MISFRRVLFKTEFLKRTLVNNVNMDEIKENAINIFLKSVQAVNPETLINNSVKLHEEKLIICGKEFTINKKNNYLVGFGKAVFNMSLALESIMCCQLARGIVSIPVGTLSSEAAQQAAHDSAIEFIEGAENNLPDTESEYAACQIAELVRNLTTDELLIVLISGGGSALLPLPKPPVTLQEKTKLIKLLSTRGADIIELNCVRKRLSELKGGGLARLAYPANAVALILSDIIGDPLDCIASGPTTPNNDAPDAAMKIVEKYALTSQLPDSIQTILSKPDVEPAHISRAPDGNFIHMTNFVIGNNKLAACEAHEEATRLGYQSRVISVAVSGDVAEISQAYANIAIETAKVMKGLSSKAKLRECLTNLQSVLNITEEAIEEVISLNLESSRVCLLAGGEPTVRVQGKGKGGRNQQLALQFAIDVNNATLRSSESVKRMNITLLSCGTDGMDGPTDAAGALGFAQLCARARDGGVEPLQYIAENDSYNFYRMFEDGRYLVKTGHTGTNVMDLHVLIIQDESPIPVN